MMKIPNVKVGGERIKVKIYMIYLEGLSLVYKYVCHSKDGLFRFPVEWQYLSRDHSLEGVQSSTFTTSLSHSGHLSTELGKEVCP
jgi:hypothetical protein